jgi:hypothetical protein
MHLRALHTAGQLDISSQEQLQGELEVFRLSLWPGQVVYVKDHWRYLKNIDSAINCGLLEVVDYNFSHVGEEVTHAELEIRLAEIDPGGITLDDLSVIQLPNSGTGTLEYNNVTGVFTYTPPLCTGGCGGGILLELTVYPQEPVDGINRTFTIPSGAYETNTICLILNGQTLPGEDIMENAGNKSVTLHPDTPTPLPGDVVVLTYMRSCSAVATDESPVETPDGINKTFTLQNGDKFYNENIGVMVNGIMIPPDGYTKSPLGTSVTLDASYPAPSTGDIIILMYSRVDNYPIEINVYSVEQPNNSHRTFTLPDSDVYITDQVELLINGQRFPKNDFIENIAKTTLTLQSYVPTPETGDASTLIYLKPTDS